MAAVKSPRCIYCGKDIEVMDDHLVWHRKPHGVWCCGSNLTPAKMDEHRDYYRQHHNMYIPAGGVLL